jgi:hypothetical protein
MSFAFSQPLLLAALAGLPVLWWLLRALPPPPKRLAFPPFLLLKDLTARSTSPERTPWWLLLLRLVLASLLILGFAGPLANPEAANEAKGPLLLAVDDGWAAARGWDKRLARMEELLAKAVRQGRPVHLLTTAPGEDGKTPEVKALGATESLNLVRTLKPKPWAVDRKAALRVLGSLPVQPGTETVWLSDGLEDGEARNFAASLARFGRLAVLLDPLPMRARRLRLTIDEGETHLRVARADIDNPGEAQIRLTDEKGSGIERLKLAFKAGEGEAKARLSLPVELIARVKRAEIEGEFSAAATLLFDDESGRRPVGLATAYADAAFRPLSGEFYYVERALSPFAEIRRGPLSDLLARDLAMLVLGDGGPVSESEKEALAAWVRAGGTLLRFAGPRLAEAPYGDALLPVRLRGGGRSMGGAMSWGAPMTLAPFADGSPFRGLDTPSDAVVAQQVLAEPAPDLDRFVWARLADGTPLVTARTEGAGRIVLVHTTADARWSNVPLSGLFVDLLRRIAATGRGQGGAASASALAPALSLDGMGRLVQPSAFARPLDSRDFEKAVPGPAHPPGLYGLEGTRRAFNLGQRIGRPVAIDPSSFPADTALASYEQPLAAGQTDLAPFLLGTALVLFALDLLLSLRLRGAFALLLLTLVIPPAQADERLAVEAGLAPRLAFVLTGSETVDTVSRQGLEGLTRMLARRTTADLAPPQGLDLDRDPLLVFPVLYWPVTPDAKPLSALAVAKVNAYLGRGGMILFDTADAGSAGGEASRRLAQLGRDLNVPPLKPVPPDHVLLRTYYLLRGWPGRRDGGLLWVEAGERPGADGVSPVIVGAHDWAAAWAADAKGRPLYAVAPGGEAQREIAFRFGINLVMYALTGNYKSDQVHLPAILERLKR